MKGSDKALKIGADFKYDAVEAILMRQGVMIEERKLLKQVFTHDSYLGDTHEVDAKSNEELEFLGDAVLNLVVSEQLYDLGVQTEGRLTKLRSSLVNNQRLAAIASDLGLGSHLLLSQGEIENGGERNEKILSGCFEALVGALYIDQEYKQASKFVHAVLLVDAKQMIEERLDVDSKSDLNQYCQRLSKAVPEYRTLSQAGPDHARVFEVAVYLADREVGCGHGSSKQQAEKEAAKDALSRISGGPA